jgi:acetyl-CoA carboxylase carboxyltransferase component
MAEMVIGEKVTLEEMGGARMHCEVSGCGDLLASDEDACLRAAREYFAYLPQHSAERVADVPARPPGGSRRIDDVLPARENQAFDMMEIVAQVIDGGSFFEVKKLFAREIITGFARIEGRAVGIVANQPKWKGGVLFIDSADKAARFVWLCDAFNIPLLFLADVPGFMIGKAVERQGIIRHGAKMISAIADATVPKICVVVRKAYGAGLYAMAGPAFDADATIALPQAMIAVMGAEAAINAVFANKIAARPEAERPAYVEELRAQYRADIDIVKLAANLHVDAVVPGDELRAELCRRFAACVGKVDRGLERRRAVLPV